MKHEIKHEMKHEMKHEIKFEIKHDFYFIFSLSVYNRNNYDTV